MSQKLHQKEEELQKEKKARDGKVQESDSEINKLKSINDDLKLQLETFTVENNKKLADLQSTLDSHQ